MRILGLDPGSRVCGYGVIEETAGELRYIECGILTAPDGRSYAVVVMIKKTATPLSTRMTLMNNVVRATITQHEMTHGTRIGL